MEYLVHVANVLYLLSYSVRDILWLRILTVVAGGTLVPFYYSQPKPLWAPIYWMVAFTAINGYQIYRLLLERRPVRLKPDESHLYNLCFRTLSPREFVKLLALGEWVEHPCDGTVVECGEQLDRVMVLSRGRAAVKVDGDEVAKLAPGQFVGEMSYLTGDPPSANVEATEDLRAFTWPSEPLRAFLKVNTDIRAALQNIIGTDLVDKLRHGPGRVDAATPSPQPA